MIRALMVISGLLMVVTGVVACWTGGIVNGWWIIAAMGFALLVADLYIEHRDHTKANGL